MSKWTITSIGSLVDDFLEEGIIILFGPEATPDLQEISIVHDGIKVKAPQLCEGGQIVIGTMTYHIKKVGEHANQSLNELGHVSLYFRETDGADLPGSVVIEPDCPPEIMVGDQILVKKKLS